jgi:hypothetical protein
MIYKNEEIATILAALRFYQREIEHGLVPYPDEEYHIMDVATDGQTLEPLTPEQIDDLCEQINFDRRL